MKKFKDGKCSIKDTFEIKTSVEKKSSDSDEYAPKPTTLEVTVGANKTFIGEFIIDLASYVDKDKVQEVLKFEPGPVNEF